MRDVRDAVTVVKSHYGRTRRPCEAAAVVALLPLHYQLVLCRDLENLAAVVVVLISQFVLTLDTIKSRAAHCLGLAKTPILLCSVLFLCTGKKLTAREYAERQGTHIVYTSLLIVVLLQCSIFRI